MHSQFKNINPARDLPVNQLTQWFSKCGPRIKSTNITWELVINVNSQIDLYRLRKRPNSFVWHTIPTKMKAQLPSPVFSFILFQNKLSVPSRPILPRPWTRIAPSCIAPFMPSSPLPQWKARRLLFSCPNPGWWNSVPVPPWNPLLLRFTVFSFFLFWTPVCSIWLTLSHWLSWTVAYLCSC